MNVKSKGLLLVILIPLFFAGLVIFQLLVGGRTEIEFQPTPVQIGQLERRTLEEQITFSGNLQPETTAQVIPKVSGRIIELFVREGAVVTQDQPLARLDDDVLRIQTQQARAAWEAADAQYQRVLQGARPEEIESAQASLDQARADLENARSNFERTENLFRAGTISQARFEEARNAFTNAQTQVENAQRSVNLLRGGARIEEIQAARSQAESALRQYELAQLQLSYTIITSPVTGRVARVLSDEGNLASPQAPLFSIISEGTIFARIPVPEGLYSRFFLNSENIRARVRAIAFPGEPLFAGTITRVGSTIDPLTRTFEVEVGIENRQELLRPGMYVNVTFTLNTLENALSLPVRSVLLRDGQQVVFVFTQDHQQPQESSDSPNIDGSIPMGLGVVEMRPVVVGTQTRTTLEIIDGIDTNDWVVVAGNSFLEHGQRVRANVSPQQLGAQ
jgi:HlyD family secretion protein